METMTPVDYLTAKEISTLNKVKNGIRNSEKKDELVMFEFILDTLLKKSFKRYKTMNNH